MKQVERYIPQGSVKVASKVSSAVAYLYQSGSSPAAIMYQGKASKPFQHFRYASEEKRAASLQRFFAQIEAVEALKAKRKAEKKAEMAKPAGVEVGQIFACSWGWEQTQVEFFKVAEIVGPRSVKVVKIGQEKEYTHSMQGYASPVPERVISEPMLKRIGLGGGFKVYEHSSAYPLAGRERLHFSEYA